MLRVGLTGGIASGKSVVAAMFAVHRVPVVDTDLIAREVVAPGEPGLAAVVAAFGPGVLNPQGTLNRAKLRRRVFSNSASRRQLEAILHPLIRARTLATLAQLEAPYSLVAVPLLVETGFDSLLDRVLVVDCPRDIQLQRLMARDAQSRAEADSILAAQASRAERLAAADDVIDNGGSLQDTERQVQRLHQRYLELAATLPATVGSRRIDP